MNTKLKDYTLKEIFDYYCLSALECSNNANRYSWGKYHHWNSCYLSRAHDRFALAAKMLVGEYPTIRQVAGLLGAGARIAKYPQWSLEVRQLAIVRLFKLERLLSSRGANFRKHVPDEIEKPIADEIVRTPGGPDILL